MKSGAIVTAFALSLVLIAPTFAREPLTVIEMIDHIEELLRNCSWETRNLKGGPLGEMLLHKNHGRRFGRT